MSHSLLPTLSDIKDVFAEEVAAAGGTVSDTYDDGRRLFLRSILPLVREVKARDEVQGGVALRTTVEEIRVHPYVFRQVCRNGAIMAHALQTRIIERCEEPEIAFDVTVRLREALQECASEEAFATAAEAMRSATTTEVDVLLQLIPTFSRLGPGVAAQVLGPIMDGFQSGRDRSLFGLMNVVTATARDTRDPELRWQLEELGGGIPALILPRLTPSGAAAELLLRA